MRSYSPATLGVLRLLGLQIATARREQQMSAAELAERVGVSLPTLRGVERGSPTVAIGAYVEAATVLRVPLYAAGADELRGALAHQADRLALLPRTVRRLPDVDDDF